MASTFSEFDEAKEDWLSYTERMEQYFIANDIKDEKRRAFLLSVCGPSLYQLIKDLVAPGKPSEQSFEQLVALIETHKNPRPSTIVQRFHFHSRAQGPTETTSEYVAVLRRLAVYCDFGEILDDMLRDRLVCGLRDSRLQRRLLAEKDLTLKKAFDLCQAYETAERDAHDIHFRQKGSSSDPQGKTESFDQSPIDKVKSIPVKERCYKCGRFHFPKNCPFKDAECFNCGKRGHIARVCRKSRTPQHTNTIDDANESVCDTHMLFSVSNRRTPPIVLKVAVNGQNLPMELDTGASVSLISEVTWRKLQPFCSKLQPSTVKLCTYTGEIISALGEVVVNMHYNNQQHEIRLVVVKGEGPCLLGRDWLQTFQVDWKEVHYATANPTLEDVVEKHSSLFSDELGKVVQHEARIHVEPEARPVFLKPRPVPYALREKVDLELQHLEKTRSDRASGEL